MADYVGSQLITMNKLAGADLSSSQYLIVKMASTAGEVVVAGNGEGIGVLQNDPADGEVAIVGVLGISKVVAEASVSAGTAITANSTGQAQTTTTANNDIIGSLSEASSTAGDIVQIVLSGFSNY